LVLIAASIEHIEVELSAPHKLGDLLDALVLEHWPTAGYSRQSLQAVCKKLAEGGSNAAGWYFWYAVQTAGGRNTLIGRGS
jgi:predicted alpha/beta-hydrolase family hydrolase